MNRGKLICILIVILAVFNIAAYAEDTQVDNNEMVKSEEENTKPDSRDTKKEEEVQYRSFRNHPSMHSPEPDPGTDPDDHILDSNEDSNEEE